MINTLIFDFGNVFINLDIEGNLQYAFEKFKIDNFSDEMLAFNSFYEQGLISTEELLEFYNDNFPHLSNQELIDIWNFMLKDFPKHRLEFLQQLKKEGKYKLILLSNTNDLHIDWIKEQVPFFEEFKTCFDQFYLSHEIQLRKPNKDIFEFVLNENKLKASECFFVDDNTDNCKTAETLGIKTWNINPKTEDVCTLFKTEANIF
ncbi:HAD family hydrolase [Aestuariibaculum lutulentum]|uniref:HAD family phosphatase n=1 Tax=Aestuariibaculum lutulentum TaxID=2920935 RepID=A0ABS9RJ83_9FLAO|nr:HAD family phosphatase [Aestuariibaculum lutulentum]MCH4553010.1 HAD family phosphatase [Aestuariibaculum lutulentum]